MRRSIVFLFLALFVLPVEAQDKIDYQIHFQIPRHQLAITSIDYRIDKISIWYMIQGKEYHLADIITAGNLSQWRDEMRVEASFYGIHLHEYADIEVWAVAYNSKGSELDRTYRAKARVFNPSSPKDGAIKLTFQKLIP